MSSSWLTLQEYSNKQGVSISTLRRKIKAGEMEFNLKKGRYLLKAPLEESKESFSIEELKSHYENLLAKKSKDIQKLKDNCEDLLQLVDLLEKEKENLLEELRDSSLKT